MNSFPTQAIRWRELHCPWGYAARLRERLLRPPAQPALLHRLAGHFPVTTQLGLHWPARLWRLATHLFPARPGPGDVCGASRHLQHFHVAVETNQPKALPAILSASPEDRLPQAFQL